MKILHINRNYVDTLLHQLMVEQLERIGYANDVFVPRLYNEKAKIIPNSNVSVCECFANWHKFFFFYKQRRIFRAAQSTCDFDGYDLIHAYTLFTDGNCARMISKKHGIPYVVAVRNTDVNDFFRLMPHLRRRGIRIMLDAKAIFFLSEPYRKQVFEKYIPKKYHAVLMKKSHIIPNGIDDFWFENLPEQENRVGDPIKLIYAGRIDRNKNIHTTQKAMELLRGRGYHLTLTVVGRVEEQKIYDKIKEDPYTECLTPHPKETLLGLYRRHNLFVMPSFTESFGLVYAEAMSQGLPVIYSQGQGFDNQFPEGFVGYRVDAHNAEALADAIERVVQNFSNIAPNTVAAAKKFNWNEISARYDRIYKTILGEDGE